jgi:hypothetical protein
MLGNDKQHSLPTKNHICSHNDKCAPRTPCYVSVSIAVCGVPSPPPHLRFMSSRDTHVVDLARESKNKSYVLSLHRDYSTSQHCTCNVFFPDIANTRYIHTTDVPVNS